MQLGLIRHGRLLTESSSEQLLNQFQCSSLEDAFLTLSQIQENTAVTNITEVYRSKAEDNKSDILCQNNCIRTKVNIKQFAVFLLLQNII